MVQILLPAASIRRMRWWTSAARRTLACARVADTFNSRVQVFTRRGLPAYAAFDFCIDCNLAITAGARNGWPAVLRMAAAGSNSFRPAGLTTRAEHGVAISQDLYCLSGPLLSCGHCLRMLETQKAMLYALHGPLSLFQMVRNTGNKTMLNKTAPGSLATILLVAERRGEG